MINDILELLIEHAAQPTRESVARLLTEVLTLTAGDIAEAAQQVTYIALRYRAAAELGATLLDVRSKPSGLNVPLSKATVRMAEQLAPARRSRGKPRTASRLPDGLNTKTVGKFAYWAKLRARSIGIRMTNRDAARVELKKLLRGLEPTEQEIQDVAKRVSEAESRD